MGDPICMPALTTPRCKNYVCFCLVSFFLNIWRSYAVSSLSLWGILPQKFKNQQNVWPKNSFLKKEYWIKFSYSEKAAKIVASKPWGRFRQIFVAFSEKLNFSGIFGFKNICLPLESTLNDFQDPWTHWMNFLTWLQIRMLALKIAVLPSKLLFLWNHSPILKIH